MEELSATVPTMTREQDRVARERFAYDQDDVWTTSDRWHRRFIHVFESPNSIRHEQLFERVLRTGARERDVLELGCGAGEIAAKIHSYGARYVLGVDVSDKFLGYAQVHAIPGQLEFANHDISLPFGRQFDVVVGRAVLHHVDYRTVVSAQYNEALRDGGVMLFMEPIGSNILLRLFTFLVRKAHTPDERSFREEDLAWFRDTFDDVEIHPFNFASLVAGIVSSKLFSSADNWLLRLADRLDVWLARRFPGLAPQFRSAVIIVRKHAARDASVRS